jgi:putative tryptophan/tyrosine transport system substrate-binding protein
MLRPVAARQQAPMRRVGILWPAASPPAPPRLEWFTQALRQLGFTEGHNLAIELRYAQQGLQQIPELAAELARMNVEVVAAFGDLAPKAMQQASKAVPIVAMADDILGAEIVTSLSRPGGNTTGVTVMAPELSQKRLELLSEIAPGLRRVAALWDPSTGASQVSATERAARTLKLELQILEVRRREDVIDAFRSAHTGAAEGLSVFSSPLLSSAIHEIIDLSAKYRLPAVYQWKEHVEAGGLISYGPSLEVVWGQAAKLVGKILNGTKPADLPVEEPVKLEVAVNATTAKALGITIPASVLVQADEVIALRRRQCRRRSDASGADDARTHRRLDCRKRRSDARLDAQCRDGDGDARCGYERRQKGQ